VFSDAILDAKYGACHGNFHSLVGTSDNIRMWATARTQAQIQRDHLASDVSNLLEWPHDERKYLIAVSLLLFFYPLIRSN